MKFIISGLLLVVGYTLCLTQASKVTIFIDDNDIAEVTKEVCEDVNGYNKQITRISTIKNLADHIESSESLTSCKSKYGESVRRLNDIISSDVTGLCSNQRIGLIEQFHRDYVSTMTKFKDIRKETGRLAPKLIKLFFMQYATRISTLCSELATKILKETEGQVEDKDKDEMKKMLTALKSMEYDISSLKSHDDIFLVWNLIESLPSVLLGEKNKYIDLTKETKLNVEVSDITNAVKLQDVCKDKAKPIYDAVMLPVIRLSDIGYYPENDSLLRQLQQSDFTRIIYTTTVLCENILPVKFIQNEYLEEGKIVMVELSRVTDNHTTSNKESSVTTNEVQKIKTEMPDTIVTENQQDAYTKIKYIKSRVKSRGRVLKQLIKRIISVIKRMPSSASDILVMGDTEEPIIEYASQVHEQDILVIDANYKDVALTRQRRSSTLKKILSPFKAVGKFILGVLYYMVIYFPLKIVFPSILIIILVIFLAVSWPFEKLAELIAKG